MERLKKEKLPRLPSCRRDIETVPLFPYIILFCAVVVVVAVPTSNHGHLFPLESESERKKSECSKSESLYAHLVWPFMGLFPNAQYLKICTLLSSLSYNSRVKRLLFTYMPLNQCSWWREVHRLHGMASSRCGDGGI